jgi:hypothetical protein
MVDWTEVEDLTQDIRNIPLRNDALDSSCIELSGRFSALMVRVAKEGLFDPEGRDRKRRKLSRCPVPGCKQNFKTWNGFCLHIGRKHKDWLRWLLKIGRYPSTKRAPYSFA